MKLLAQTRCVVEKLGKVGGPYVSKPNRDLNLRLELRQRAMSNRDMLQVLAAVLPNVTFCDIRGDRHRGALHLTGESEHFAPRKFERNAVHLLKEVYPCLPHT